ncbi:MAG TPA: hypothetical protein VH186_26130 [Chloroflexia bacterium]|nr:hypothetical protein [Chloroflexia bacterium]
MNQSPLTVIVNIKPAEGEPLEKLLTDIGHNVRTNPYIRFNEIDTTHFARFVIIPGPGKTEAEPKRLLFTSNHDGSWQDYIELLIDKAGPGVEAIWGKCEGYPEIPLSDPAFKTRFKTFIQANSHPSEAFYQAYPGQAVKEVWNAVGVRKQLEDLLSDKRLEPFLSLLARLPLLPQTPLQKLRAALMAVNSLLVRFLLREVVLRFFEKTLGPKIDDSPTDTDSKDVNTHPEYTDWLNTVQNEMTVMSVIAPERLRKLRLFFGVVRLAVKYNPTPGALLGISTIHFARWVIIDGGKNLLFESNYDGNWEQYIGDFVDKASGGMDAIWGSYPAYPARGAKDLQAFKQVIMDNQVRALVFYSAYPDSSVRNILNDLKISQDMAKLIGQEKVADLLSRI